MSEDDQRCKMKSDLQIVNRNICPENKTIAAVGKKMSEENIGKKEEEPSHLSKKMFTWKLA
jgi:hypothetical protein